MFSSLSYLFVHLFNWFAHLSYLFSHLLYLFIHLLICSPICIICSPICKSVLPTVYLFISPFDVESRSLWLLNLTYCMLKNHHHFRRHWENWIKSQVPSSSSYPVCLCLSACRWVCLLFVGSSFSFFFNLYLACTIPRLEKRTEESKLRLRESSSLIRRRTVVRNLLPERLTVKWENDTSSVFPAMVAGYVFLFFSKGHIIPFKHPRLVRRVWNWYVCKCVSEFRNCILNGFSL